jgi:hypothetical protein
VVFFLCFGVCCRVRNSTPAEYDRSHPSAFERTWDHPTRLRLTTVKPTHERTSGERSSASDRRSNVDHDRTQVPDVRTQLQMNTHLQRSIARLQSAAKQHFLLFIVFNLLILHLLFLCTFLFSFLFQLSSLFLHTLFLLY